MLSPFVPANAGTQESEAVSFWVYILASRRNGTLYVGMTDDLARRSWEHRTGARTKRKSRNLGPRFRGDERRHGTGHSTFRFSLRTSVPHFVSSLSMSLAYSSGVEVKGVAAFGHDALLDLGALRQRAQLGVEARDDRPRRARRRQQPVMQH